MKRRFHKMHGLGNDFVVIDARQEPLAVGAAQARAIADHIPYVVGMTRAIGDEAAIKFAVGFYDALGAGRSYEDAFLFGRNAIRLHSIPEHVTPKLIAV